MNLISNRIRGMQDILFEDGQKLMAVCDIMMREAENYGFKFARTPVLEYTQLFKRSSGDTSEVVNKEMYTFEDKSGRSISLRPEGTAGIMRAVLENGVSNYALPIKLMYNASCYRYEKPQSGRYREFFQFGLEVFGSSSVLVEVELINLAKQIFNKLGILDVSLEINSIGCKDCRKKYISVLKEYFYKNKDKLCKSCIEKIEKNPLRILDCKEIFCKELSKNAPVITDYICNLCSENLKMLENRLENTGIEYVLNPKIVRGLDYYTGIVFEFVINVEGEPLTICGGGRYDGLSEILGGPSLPAVGLGIGIERVILELNRKKISPKYTLNPEIYIASTDEKSSILAEKLCCELRNSGIYAEYDICKRSLKAQMKYAGKIGVKFSLVLGEDELNSGNALIKNMQTGEKTLVSIKNDFARKFSELKI